MNTAITNTGGIKTVFYTNGIVNDPAFTGVTIASYLVDADGKFVSEVMETMDGKVFLGYMPKEVTEAEYLQWKERIANPDNVDFFAGIFAGIGVIDKATHNKLVAQIQAAEDAKELDRKAHLSVKRVQALIALNRSGTTKPDIYAAIDTLPANQKEEALLWFEDSQNFVRNHPYINALGQKLGYSQTQLDDLFALAETIK